ncbi:hypothetical protein CLV59_103373 [Chitinophaga dinghuensis]|uniref:6-bladed beta-propeller protein n=1 Tax=Chitinophaga dinghuensis TaxID=1539050 RepID=A0A327W4V9_9BACT|nr:hypothetical protein [Chitinophaga dinghuensis]RAJ83406.1 hypothetical protein CLV59_103373 [Chitinophaga dinghuensis]
MIKKILSIAALNLMFTAGITMAQGQTPEVSRSVSFKEPSAGACKLLQMKNGNTLFFHFSKKKGIEVAVFDTKHKMSPIVNNHVESFKTKQLGTSDFKGLFEINGQALLFLVRYEHRSPLLYRFTFDGKSGKLIEEKVVGEIEKLPITAGYAVVYGGVGLPSFDVKKDPESDYYAVATINTFAHESNARIKITHYSPEHKVINEGNYASPKNKYKYLNLLEMYVHGDEYVFLTTFGYNTAKSGGKDSKVFVSRLSKGSKDIAGEYMSSARSIESPIVGLKYNAVNKQLYMLSGVNAKSIGLEHTMYSADGNMVLKMNTIDPASLKISPDAFVKHPELSSYAQKNLKYKNPYTGVIQDFRLHEDGTATIMFEELEAKVSTSSYMSASGSFSSSTHTSTRLGDIGVVRVSADGKEMPGSYAIAKSQFTNGWLSPYYLYRRAETGWNYNRGAFKGGANNNNFFSFDYMYVNDKAYAIYNDFSENIEREDENYRGRKKMRGVSDANTVLAWYDGEKIQRSYLFGDPGNKDIARFSRIDMNTHSADEKSFATLMIERKGRKKEAYIVWVKF